MDKSGVVVARKLILLSGGAKGVVYPLAEPKIELGRDSNNTIQLEGASISRHHAVLDRTNGEYTIRDLHSSNGTFLNDQPVQEAHLKPGDRFRLGETELSYETANEPTVTASPVASLPAPAEELAALRRQLAAAEEQLTASLQQVSARTAELDLARREFTAAEEQSALQLEKLAKQTDALSADLATARRQAEELRAANERATEESARVCAQSETTANEQERRITQLVTDNERLAAEMCVANEALKTVRTELETLADVRRQSEDLAKRGEELMSLLMAEKEEVEVLRWSGNQQSVAFESATVKLAGLAAEVKRLQAQLEQAQQGADKAEEEKRLLTFELGAVRGQLAALQRESQDRLTAAQQCFAEELLNLRAELDKARQASGRIPELTTQKDKLTSQNSELLARISALQLREAKVAPLEAEVATLRDALKSLNDELVEARQACSRFSELTSQKDQLTSQNNELLARISALQLGETKVAALEAEVTTLRNALKSLNDELVEARTTAKLNVVTKKLDRLAKSSGVAGTTELAALRAELTKACGDWAELRELPPVVDRLTRENEELRVAMAKAQEEATLAKRCLSDQTSAAFAQIRRDMPTKQSGNGDSKIGGKDGGLLRPLGAARRAFGLLPKR
jgi:pSer/pThr/pTyr-binding forkhead associated (FHA) protein